MEKTINSKNILFMIILIIVALISIFAIAPLTSSTNFHYKTIKSLDNKKITVAEITAATAVTATALAAVPGDATTPLANQILGLSSYLIIIIGAIFLEKILLTLTGYITFTFLIPIACLLYGISICSKIDILKKLAIKLGLFGIIIFIVVPLSVKISDVIEETYQTSINQTIENGNNIKTKTEENTNGEENGWNGFISNLKDGISNLGDNVSKSIQKGKEVLGNFIDAIAILLITSCVIPIVVLLSFIWIIKIIFGVNIPIQNIQKFKLNNSIKKRKLNSSLK